MKPLDETQQQVLGLSKRLHARVIGAAGAGKTMLITELMRTWIEENPDVTEDVLVIAPSRIHAAVIRSKIESTLNVPLRGTPVRTMTSLALHMLNQERNREGLPALQLMMGTRQDEILREVLVDSTLASTQFDPEVTHQVGFRTELRDLWRVLDDFGMFPSELLNSMQSPRWSSDAEQWLTTWGERWRVAAMLLQQAQAVADTRYPHERTSSGVLREATNLVNAATSAPQDIPQLLLIDDAVELGEGDLALCAALANHGTKLWVFGDPDTATSSFQGSTSRVLTGVHRELVRKGASRDAIRGEEQAVTLAHVHRHGAVLRSLVQNLSERVGASAGFEHREARATDESRSNAEFTIARTFSEQIGIIAHRLRHRHLGLHDAGVRIPWHEMAVICRSAEQAEQLASALEDAQVPTRSASGGVVLGRNALVRSLLRILQDALGLEPITPADILHLLHSPVCGMDPVSYRRLDHAVLLAERKRAKAEEREPMPLADVYADMLMRPDTIPDLEEGRVFARLARIVAAARSVQAHGGTPREVLWAVWEASNLSETLVARALHQQGAPSALAHAHLDAVIDTFFVLQRHEEQVSDVPVAELIEELLVSDLPQDTIAQRSTREAVLVTTPQGASAEEFAVVCIAGPQEGVWPNMRVRGTLVGAYALEACLSGEAHVTVGRSQLVHDELRLLISAVSRARDELLVVAREDDEEFPSPFFYLGSPLFTENLPSSTLTLRGYTAELRRRLLLNPADTQARNSLIYLMQRNVAGADPQSWYGMQAPSTQAPLVDLAEEDAVIRVNPSHIDSAEECPLNWFVTTMGAEQGPLNAQLGTLLHYALEHVDSGSQRELQHVIDEAWHTLEFEAPWIEHQYRAHAEAMVSGLAEYLRDARANGKWLDASEARFTLSVGKIRMTGVADRIEISRGPDGQEVPRIVDLKTGRHPISARDADTHAQLLAYQLGLLEGTFTLSVGEETETSRTYGKSGGAALLYVHPDATTTKQDYRIIEQPPLTPEYREAVVQRITEIATVMADGSFTAEIEHHCADPMKSGQCAIHIIPAVSFG